MKQKIYNKKAIEQSGGRRKLRTTENRILEKYWSKVGGQIYTEVPIGGPGGNSNWPHGSVRRRIDGVRLLVRGNRGGIFGFRRHKQDFIKQINGRTVELIEVKQTLNRPVIGQMVAGKVMFERQYKAVVNRQVVLFQKGDPALEWVCRRIGINVKKI